MLLAYIQERTYNSFKTQAYICVLVAGNEVKDSNDARNPTDEDDSNPGPFGFVCIFRVQWFLNDHVDTLVKEKHSDSAQGQKNL